MRQQGVEHAFQFANVRIDTVGDVFDHVVRNVHAVGMDFLLQDRDARFHIRHMDVGGQTPFEAREQTGFHAGHVGRGLVRCQYDLLLRLVEVVEDIEKRVLGTFAAGQLVYVVYEQYVNELIKVREIVGVTVSARIHELLHEIVGRYI